MELKCLLLCRMNLPTIVNGGVESKSVFTSMLDHHCWYSLHEEVIELSTILCIRSGTIRFLLVCIYICILNPTRRQVRHRRSQLCAASFPREELGAYQRWSR